MVKVRRLKPLPASIFIEGFPGVGLAGYIAAKYIAEKLNMEPVAFVTSKRTQPIVTISQGRILYPITIYGNGEAYILVAESFVPPEIIGEVASVIFDEFIDSKNVKLGISLGGSAVMQMLSEERKISFIASSEPAKRIVKEKLDVSEIQNGIIMGLTAGLLSEAYMRREDYIVLLAEADPTKPDPIASLALVKAINKLLDRNVDTKDLEKAISDIEAQHKRLHNHIKEQLKKSGVDEISHLYYV